MGKDDTETCNKSIQAIKNETKNMNELVSKLLYITRADTGKINLKKTKINIQELIGEIIEETKLIETDRNIYSSSNEICYIEADISNVKELIRIFIDNSFYRIDKSRNKETGGVGLGLAIAKSIASINGAEIKLESELGKGSNFILIFKGANLK